MLGLLSSHNDVALGCAISVDVTSVYLNVSIDAVYVGISLVFNQE